MTESPHDNSNAIVPEEEDWNNNASITSHMRQLTESPHDDSNGIVLKKRRLLRPSESGKHAREMYTLVNPTHV